MNLKSFNNLISKFIKRYQHSGLSSALITSARFCIRTLKHDRSDRGHTSTIQNQYINWISFAVPGMLAKSNIKAIEYAIARMPGDYPIIEIGAFSGLSTIVITHILEQYNKSNPFFTCDKWEFEGQKLGESLGGSSSVTHDNYREYVKETFNRTLKTFAYKRLPFAIEKNSDEFFDLWQQGIQVQDLFGQQVRLGGPISFCYIDGNHTQAFVERDFQNVDKILALGGYILFDDSGDNSNWEVNLVTRKIAKDSRYQVVMKNPNYLFRKIV